jgi:hypothetical protein
MLGQPVAAVAPGLGMPGEVERVVQRVGRCRPLRDGRKIENGKRYHRNPNVVTRCEKNYAFWAVSRGELGRFLEAPRALIRWTFKKRLCRCLKFTRPL